MTTPTTEELLTSINNSVTELQNAAASVAAAAHFHETANSMVADAVEQIEEARDTAMDEVAQEAHGFPIGTIADVPRKEYGNIFMDCDGSVLRKEDYGLLADVLGDIPDKLDGFAMANGTALTDIIAKPLVNLEDNCACVFYYSSNNPCFNYSDDLVNFYTYTGVSSSELNYGKVLFLAKKTVVIDNSSASGASNAHSIVLLQLNDDRSITRITLFSSVAYNYNRCFICNLIDNIIYAAFFVQGTGFQIISFNTVTNAKNTYTLPTTVENYGNVIANFVKCNNRVLFRTKNTLVYSDDNGIEWNVWEYNNVGAPIHPTDNEYLTAEELYGNNFNGKRLNNCCFCKTNNNVLFDNNATYNQFLYSTDDGTTWNVATKPWGASNKFYYVFYKNGIYYFVTTVSLYTTTDFITWESIFDFPKNTSKSTGAFVKNDILYLYDYSSGRTLCYFHCLVNLNNGKIFGQSDLAKYFTNITVNNSTLSSIVFLHNISMFIFSCSSYGHSFLKIDPETFNIVYYFDNFGDSVTKSEQIDYIIAPDNVDFFYACRANSTAEQYLLYSYDKDTEIKLPTVYSKSYLQKCAILGGAPKTGNTTIPLPPSNPLTGKYAAIRVR